MFLFLSPILIMWYCNEQVKCSVLCYSVYFSPFKQKILIHKCSKGALAYSGKSPKSFSCSVLGHIKSSSLYGIILLSLLQRLSTHYYITLQQNAVPSEHSKCLLVLVSRWTPPLFFPCLIILIGFLRYFSDRTKW